MATFGVRVVGSRAKAGGGGSVENPRGSKFWKLESVLSYFGSEAAPLSGMYFAAPDLCAYGLREEGSLAEEAGSGKFYKKAVILAATYREIVEVAKTCPGDHEHQVVRGSTKGLDGKWVRRSQLSGAYPLLLGLEWGRSVGQACLRLAEGSARQWAERQLARERKVELEPWKN